MNTLLHRQQGGVASIVAMVLFLMVVIYSVVFFVFGVIVPPSYIGVRQNKMFFTSGDVGGFVNEALPPGLHWKIPAVSEVILLPRGFQVVSFSSSEADGSDLLLPSISVPSTNGSKISTDLTLIVRLFSSSGEKETMPAPPVPGKGDLEKTVARATKTPREDEVKQGGPRDLVTNWSTSPESQLRTLATSVQQALVNSLSSLSTSEFYNPERREKQVSIANSKANELVNPYGVGIWTTLIRRFAYDPTIDDQIFAKNLQEATEVLNTAQSELAKVRAETERMRALWDAKIRDLQVKGKADADILRSQGEAYEAKRVAHGDLLVNTAQAKVDKARADALRDTEGSDTYVALQIAPLLQSLQGGVISGIDPYNLGQWMEKLLVTDKSFSLSADKGNGK